MNRCDREQRLTPFLLGDLAGPEADAMRQHLAQCPVCQATARAIEPTLHALRAGLAQDVLANPRLAASRRLKALAVHPQPRFRILRWASRPRPVLRMAAQILIVLGIISLVSSAFFPAICASRSSSKATAARNRERMLDLQAQELGVESAESPAPSEPQPVATPQSVTVTCLAGGRTATPATATRHIVDESSRLERNLEKAEWRSRGGSVQAAGGPAGAAEAAATARRPPVSSSTLGLVAGDAAAKSGKEDLGVGHAAGGGGGALVDATWSAGEKAKIAEKKPDSGGFVYGGTVAAMPLPGVIRPPPAPPMPVAVNGPLSAVLDYKSSGEGGRAPRAVHGEPSRRAAGAESSAMDAARPAPAAPAPDQPFAGQPGPAAFDSVSAVKSPVVMHGLYAARSSGARGAASTAPARKDLAEREKSRAQGAENAEKNGAEVYYRYLPKYQEAAQEEARQDVDGKELAYEAAQKIPDDQAAADPMARRRPDGATVDGIVAKMDSQKDMQSEVVDELKAVDAEKPMEQAAADMPAGGKFLRQAGDKTYDGWWNEAEHKRSAPKKGAKLAQAAQQIESVQNLVAADADGDGRPGSGKLSAEELTVKRMKEIVLPEVRFRGANVQDMAKFFTDSTKEFGAKDGKEIKFEVASTAAPNAPAKPAPAAGGDIFAPEAPAAGEGTPVTFSGRFISLYDAAKIAADASGQKLTIKGDKVVLVPANMPESDIETRNIKAPASEPVPQKKPRPQAHAFNPFVAVAENKFSTFGIDVDTASYTLTRQALFGGQLPDAEQVRTEEIVNFFDYGDAAPDRTTFRVYVEGAPSAFGAGKTLLRIGVKGRRLGREEQRPAVLTFLIDTSGSMSQPDRIGRARTALKLLLDNLGPRDRIQIVAFDDRARLVLPPTSAKEKAAVLAAFDRLQCNGSTNLEDGMRKAYQQAASAFAPGAENRVILISDGVANLGTDTAQDILREIETYRKQGITCSVFGVGSGTYNDAMLMELADKGDGMYRFLDTDDEARRVFVDDLSATLNTIARDVKIQVEWNAAAVSQYRQLGYEKRALRAEQFRDDTVDAGEVGSGQAVTALYELDLVARARHPTLDTRYPTLGTVRVRYRRADTMVIEEIEQPIVPEILVANLAKARPQLRLAASAAGFAELLRGSPYVAGKTYEDVARLLRPVALELSLDARVKELLSLVEAAGAMSK